MKKKIILATTSPYRKAAFAMLGIPFEAIGSDVEEYFDGRPDRPAELVSHLAKIKAEAVAVKCSEGIIIGFDSIGWFSGAVLEKPKSRKEMFSRLKAMSGKEYQFFTGIHLIDQLAGKTLSRAVQTDVLMRDLFDSEINWYLDQDPNFKTYAQGYDPLGTYGSTFIKELHGSYNNVLRGIPLEVIVEMLKERGFYF
jgi:MAF protein